VTIETSSELKKALKTNGYSNKAVDEIVDWYIFDDKSN
jgi:hypothetical protein